jgi:hypothetical protein
MIRKYKDVDADAVVSTWRAASEVAHPFLTREFLDREADAVRNIYLAFADTWVTEVGGEIVGFVSLVDDEVGGIHSRADRRGCDPHGVCTAIDGTKGALVFTAPFTAILARAVSESSSRRH